MEKIDIKRNPNNDQKYLNGVVESMDTPGEYLDPNSSDQENLLNESAGDSLEYFTE